jgi:hypothetical protein
MIEALESRELFAVTLEGGLTPAFEQSTSQPTVIMASNDLGPGNLQRKHASNLSITVAP